MEPHLPLRARTTLEHLLATQEGVNGFGRPIWSIPKFSDITPKAAAQKVTETKILGEINAGRKTASQIAEWLRFHGYELKP